MRNFEPQVCDPRPDSKLHLEVPFQGFGAQQKVKYEFTAEQAGSRVDSHQPTTAADEVLLRAKQARDFAYEVRSTTQKLDHTRYDKTYDYDGYVLIQNESAEAASTLVGQIRPQYTDLALLKDVEGPSGTAFVDAYFRQDGRDGPQYLGYADNSGAVEMIISPGGALTVFAS